MKFFLRDAENILNAECVLLIGTHEQAQGLNCGHCGYATCVSRKEGVPCALNSVDVALPSDQLVPRQQTTGWTHGSCSRPD